MARVGQNPMKWMDKVHQPQKVTATTVVHIPVMEGYWQESFEVLKLCLQSMRSTTSVPFDLMVFDNGSCQAVVDYLVRLKEAGFIQYLMLSDSNLGKVGAWNFLFQAAPGDIISFCDSDVYFLDGWLEESIKILENFPKAGIVSALPIAGGDLSTLKTAQMADNDPDVEVTTGILIPKEYVVACVRSLGKDKEEFERRQIDRKDVLLSIKGVEAYATASHFQFTIRKAILNQLFPVKSELPLGGDTQFDNEMVDLGYWRLSTKGYYVHHMGNRVPDICEEIPWIDPGAEKGSIELTKNAFKTAPITHSLARKILKKVNGLTYELLYGKDSTR
jgi:glycosyltransferase involved in cell wall biosynthesis